MPAPTVNYYAELGLPNYASEAQVKAASVQFFNQEQVLKAIYAANPNDPLFQKAQNIRAGLNILEDPQYKAAYDNGLRGAEKKAAKVGTAPRQAAAPSPPTAATGSEIGSAKTSTTPPGNSIGADQANQKTASATGSEPAEAAKQRIFNKNIKVIGSRAYEILGVPENASQEMIQKAYRQKALEYHPDRNVGNAEAALKYDQVQQANELIGNSENRTNYDKTVKERANIRANSRPGTDASSQTPKSKPIPSEVTNPSESRARGRTRMPVEAAATRAPWWRVLGGVASKGLMGVAAGETFVNTVKEKPEFKVPTAVAGTAPIITGAVVAEGATAAGLGAAGTVVLPVGVAVATGYTADQLVKAAKVYAEADKVEARGDNGNIKKIANFVLREELLAKGAKLNDKQQIDLNDDRTRQLVRESLDNKLKETRNKLNGWTVNARYNLAASSESRDAYNNVESMLSDLKAADTELYHYDLQRKSIKAGLSAGKVYKEETQKAIAHLPGEVGEDGKKTVTLKEYAERFGGKKVVLYNQEYYILNTKAREELNKDIKSLERYSLDSGTEQSRLYHELSYLIRSDDGNKDFAKANAGDAKIASVSPQPLQPSPLSAEQMAAEQKTFETQAKRLLLAKGETSNLDGKAAEWYNFERAQSEKNKIPLSKVIEEMVQYEKDIHAFKQEAADLARLQGKKDKEIDQFVKDEFSQYKDYDGLKAGIANVRQQIDGMVKVRTDQERQPSGSADSVKPARKLTKEEKEFMDAAKEYAKRAIGFTDEGQINAKADELFNDQRALTWGPDWSARAKKLNEMTKEAEERNREVAVKAKAGQSTPPAPPLPEATAPTQPAAPSQNNSPPAAPLAQPQPQPNTGGNPSQQPQGDAPGHGQHTQGQQGQQNQPPKEPSMWDQAGDFFGKNKFGIIGMIVGLLLMLVNPLLGGVAMLALGGAGAAADGKNGALAGLFGGQQTVQARVQSEAAGKFAGALQQGNGHGAAEALREFNEKQLAPQIAKLEQSKSPVAKKAIKDLQARIEVNEKAAQKLESKSEAEVAAMLHQKVNGQLLGKLLANPNTQAAAIKHIVDHEHAAYRRDERKAQEAVRAQPKAQPIVIGQGGIHHSRGNAVAPMTSSGGKEPVAQGIG